MAALGQRRVHRILLAVIGAGVFSFGTAATALAEPWDSPPPPTPWENPNPAAPWDGDAASEPWLDPAEQASQEQADAFRQAAEIAAPLLPPEMRSLLEDPAVLEFVTFWPRVQTAAAMSLASGVPPTADEEQELWHLLGGALTALQGNLTEFVTATLGPEATGIITSLVNWAAPAGCGTHDAQTSILSKGQYVSIEGNEVVARITVDQPLCTPLELELHSYAKIDDRPYPAPQRLVDKAKVTIQAAGTYEMRAKMPTKTVTAAEAGLAVDPCAPEGGTAAATPAPGAAPAAGGPPTDVGGIQVNVPAQLDLFRLGAGVILGTEGAGGTPELVYPTVLDYIQTDVNWEGTLSQPAESSADAAVTDTKGQPDYDPLEAPGDPDNNRTDAQRSTGPIDMSTPVTRPAGAAPTQTPPDQKVAVCGVQVERGELPNTGNDPKPLVALGIGLLVAGWLALCFGSLFGRGRRHAA